jgi:hypothetical protein
LGRVVGGVDYLDSLDRAIADGFWASPKKLKDTMDEETIAKNMEPLLTAALIPALWKLEDKNARPVIIKMPYDGRHMIPYPWFKIPPIPKGRSKADGIWWQSDGWQVQWVDVGCSVSIFHRANIFRA